MKCRPAVVGASAAPSAPTIGRLPVFTMLPRAFSSIVESPPAMLPWVGCEPSRSARPARSCRCSRRTATGTGAHLVGGAALGDDVLAAGQLAGLAEDHRAALVDNSSSELADGPARAEAGRRVGLAALHAEQQLGELHGLALQLAGVLQELDGRRAGLARRS